MYAAVKIAAPTYAHEVLPIADVVAANKGGIPGQSSNKVGGAALSTSQTDIGSKCCGPW